MTTNATEAYDKYDKDANQESSALTELNIELNTKHRRLNAL